LFKTTDGGRSWQVISPDLTRESPEIPANLGAFSAGDPEKGKHRGTIYALAPSFKEPGTLWAGTDDGLIQITRDGGKAWKNVTPSQLTSWSKVSILEASHFDAGTVYAAVNRFRLDDLNPHIYRTRDFGASWQEIVSGLPGNAPINAVREDPARKGLLFAGSETSVYVSFNDGDSWQLPAVESAAHLDARFGHSRRRPDCRYARPLVLDLGWHHSASAVERTDCKIPGVFVPAAGSLALALES